MTEKERVEERIGEILAIETQAIPLSDKPFRPDSLFNQLAGTEKEGANLSGNPNRWPPGNFASIASTRRSAPAPPGP